MATNVPIQIGDENFVMEDASDPQAQARPGGIGGRVLIRITLALAAGQRSIGRHIGGLGVSMQATSLVFHLNPLDAGCLRDELSKALGELGG